MPPMRFGLNLWSQATDWPSMLDAARRIDRLGYEHVWTWDHLYAIFGDPYQPIFEGWAAISAWAAATERVRVGLMVGANTFRNPGLVAKLAATVDHISGGRSILGLGGAWFGLEHEAHGIDFGSGFGERLGWLDESVGLIRRLLDGEDVTHAGPRYRFERLRHAPLPIQAHLPIMIGGGGERKTLRTVARHADIWNVFGTVEALRHKSEVLEEHCAAVGRDPASIERTVGCKLVIRDSVGEAERAWEVLMAHNREPAYTDDAPWLGPPARIAEIARGYLEAGFGTVIAELPAPHDIETIERFIGETAPLVNAGGG